MSHLCTKCQNISFQSPQTLGLKLKPVIESDRLSRQLRRPWETGSYYLHYPTRRDLEESKSHCQLCALIFESLVPDKSERKFLDCDQDQIFLLAAKDTRFGVDPTPLHYDVEVWLGSSSGTLLAKVYDEDTWESVTWHQPYIPNAQRENLTTGSPSAMSLARHWLKTCKENHHCAPSDDATPLLPTRVVEVLPGNSPPRIHAAAPSERGRYITLSYCWGDQKKINFLKTKKENLSQHLKALPENLHATLRDALQVTRELGFRYIWIDALCIVQDDKLDVEKEISKMGQIYRNSSLTIGAANGSDVTSGLFAQRDPFLFRPCFLTFELEGRWRRAYIHRFPHSTALALEMRLWVVQEQILSSRMLVFRPDHLEWRCCRGNIPEHTPSGFTSKRPASNINELQAIIGGSKRREIGFPYDEWYQAVGALSNRSATFKTDQLPGIAGVASILYDQFGLNDPTKYVAGLWRDDIFAGLSWVRAYVSSDNSRNTKTSLESKYIAPTWSWASSPIGLVNFPTVRGKNIWDLRHLEQLIRIDEIFCEPENAEDNPFGKIKPGAYMRITGKVKTASTQPVDCEYWFENDLRGLYTKSNGLRAAVFDAEATPDKPQIVGLITFDTMEDRLALPPVNCMPILKFPNKDSSELPCTMICLALTKQDGKYRRVGIIGLFRGPRFIEKEDESGNIDWVDDVDPGDVYWDSSVWADVPESTMTII